MTSWDGPGFVDSHAHLLEVAAGAIPTGPDPFRPSPLCPGGERALVTGAYHCRVAADGSTPMDQPALPFDQTDLPGALERGLRAAAGLGLVEITEAGMPDWRYYDGLRRLRDQGPLPLAVRLLVGSGVADLARMRPTGDPWLELAGVKFYADGWLGLRTCALSHDYADRPGDRGILFLDAETLARRAAPFAEEGWTIATHAIGDRAIETVLDAYEMVFGSDCAGAGPRIEHVQVLRPDLVTRMAELGVVACIQPSFAVADAADAEEALGERAGQAYRWADLMAAGVTVVAGSDYPVETLSPLWGLQRLVTGSDVGGERVAEPLDLDQALSIMTDPEVGTVTLDADPRAVEPAALHLVSVRGTVVRVSEGT